MVSFQPPVNAKPGYGWVLGVHKALDYPVPVGTPVGAIGPGTVIQIGDDGALGDTLRIQHADGYESLYGNLTTYTAKPGDVVTAGQQIGTSGGAVGSKDQGDSTGPHLPLQIWLNGKAVNPSPLLAGSGVVTLASFNPFNLPAGVAAAGNAGTILGALSSKKFWLQTAFVTAGATLLIIALIVVVSHSQTGQNAISSIKTATKVAAEIPK